MIRPSPLLVATAFPSTLLLLYLSMHVTEGWQLLVVGMFAVGFLASWLRRSRWVLAASYLLTVGLCSWVVAVNR